MLKHCLIVFGVSMVPLIELRGAIPYGIAFGFIFYPLVMIAAGRRKELNWIIWLMFVLFLLLLATLTMLKF